MLIQNLKTQKWLLGISSFGFLSLMLMKLFHNTWLSLLDTVTIQLEPKMLPNYLRIPFNLFYSFNTGFLVFVVMFLFVFFFWGFKFKIPAAWVGFTSIGGAIILIIFNLMLNGITHQTFPAHAAFWVTLIYSFWVIFVQPELTTLRRRWHWSIATLCLIIWGSTMLYSLFQPGLAFSGILAGWFLAIIWLEACEILYVRYAHIASKMPIFHNSWY